MDVASFGNFKEVSGSNEYVIRAGTTDKTPAILNKMTLSIENELELYPEIGYNYRQNVICGKRNISMNLIGFIQTNDIWTAWKDTWDDTSGYYTTIGSRLNSIIQ